MTDSPWRRGDHSAKLVDREAHSTDDNSLSLIITWSNNWSGVSTFGVAEPLERFGVSFAGRRAPNASVLFGGIFRVAAAVLGGDAVFVQRAIDLDGAHV